ncbi:MAG: hypothetical protein ACLT76_03705 [Clostridium fessum]
MKNTWEYARPRIGRAYCRIFTGHRGSIGYFPSYALGNAFGAQIYHQMKKELPVEKLLEAGNLGEIREYLRKNIHQYGKLKDSRQILRDMTGEDFNPSYYVAYLEEKYGRPEKVQ